MTVHRGKAAGPVDDPFLLETVDDDPAPDRKTAAGTSSRTMTLPADSDAPAVQTPADDAPSEIRVTANQPIAARRPSAEVASLLIRPGSSRVELLPSPPGQSDPATVTAAPAPSSAPPTPATLAPGVAESKPIVAEAKLAPPAVDPAVKPAEPMAKPAEATSSASGLRPLEPEQPRLPTVWKAGVPENLTNLVSVLESRKTEQPSLKAPASERPEPAEVPSETVVTPAPLKRPSTTPLQIPQVSVRRPLPPAVIVPRRTAARLAGRIELEPEMPLQRQLVQRARPAQPAALERHPSALAETPETGPNLLPTPVYVSDVPLPQSEGSDIDSDPLAPLPLEQASRPKLTSASRLGLALGLAGLLGIGLWRFLEWRRFRRA